MIATLAIMVSAKPASSSCAFVRRRQGAQRTRQRCHATAGGGVLLPSMLEPVTRWEKPHLPTMCQERSFITGIPIGKPL